MSEIDKNHSVYFMHPSFCTNKEEYLEICRKGRENDRARDKSIKPDTKKNGKNKDKELSKAFKLEEKPADEDIYKNIKELDKE